MRTDSTRVADSATEAVRGYIGTTYGQEYLPPKPILYKSKKGAQDAHEAIRPTEMRYAPDEVMSQLTKDELALYKLIWNRFVASQIKPALYDEIIVEIEAADYLLRAKGSVLKFKGFLAAYGGKPGRQAQLGEKRGRSDHGEGAPAPSLWGTS